ncbi:MAG: hypothetical protein OEW09_19040, partial [Anaerolineae bacterium]|nr:hypothetical protein [Anaerolineae bacterium]
HCRLGDIPQVHIAIPFPKTRMHDIAVKMGFISEDFIPNTSLYDSFLFHDGHEKKIMTVIYNIFPISRIIIPEEFDDISFLGRYKMYKGGKTIGDIINMDMGT